MEYDEEIIDEIQDGLDTGTDIQDSQLDAYEGSTTPESQEKQSIYTWFWKVVKLQDPFKIVKVGNLSNTEVGETDVSVRDCMNLAHLGTVFKHNTFADYFNARAKITSATSMAKKGWFMDLSISQKKVRERTKASSSGQERWKMFNRKNNTQQEA